MFNLPTDLVNVKGCPGLEIKRRCVIVFQGHHTVYSTVILHYHSFWYPLNLTLSVYIVELETIRKHAVDVTLDPDTAHPKLILSEDRKQVRYGDIKQNLPDNPKRFDIVPYVLGKESFSSGRFYYEVQVEGKNGWTLGVARESINRKKYIRLKPENGCWTVWLRFKEYKALTDPSVVLSLREKPHKVGVFVDYEKGQVSFYNVEARSHIYSFTGYTFTEKLYPFFYSGATGNSAPQVITPVGVTD
ncbi:butyrophilin subfamily 2 member A2-like [Oncorhynchus mykiss]|uniref:butyrophilin subfamily 2 member A2-like n=1 Tax=Oncorhynchus mykiss TaxID=8022 RepID=UPI0018778AFA|nr:butyrophilin subfamily 2 member A2-like [Oncorhynchus mykiss]